jgi:hypothetical protein
MLGTHAVAGQDHGGFVGVDALRTRPGVQIAAQALDGGVTHQAVRARRQLGRGLALLARGPLSLELGQLIRVALRRLALPFVDRVQRWPLRRRFAVAGVAQRQQVQRQRPAPRQCLDVEQPLRQQRGSAEKALTDHRWLHLSMLGDGLACIGDGSECFKRVLRRFAFAHRRRQQLASALDCVGPVYPLRKSRILRRTA